LFGAKFYCLHVLDDHDWRILIRDKNVSVLNGVSHLQHLRIVKALKGKKLKNYQSELLLCFQKSATLHTATFSPSEMGMCSVKVHFLTNMHDLVLR